MSSDEYGPQTQVAITKMVATGATAQPELSEHFDPTEWAQRADELDIERIAALIYQHRWYGVPGQNLGRCNCHWDDTDAPPEITYAEHTRHVAEVIVHADTGAGEGER